MLTHMKKAVVALCVASSIFVLQGCKTKEDGTNQNPKSGVTNAFTACTKNISKADMERAENLWKTMEDDELFIEPVNPSQTASDETVKKLVVVLPGMGGTGKAVKTDFDLALESNMKDILYVFLTPDQIDPESGSSQWYQVKEPKEVNVVGTQMTVPDDSDVKDSKGWFKAFLNLAMEKVNAKYGSKLIYSDIHVIGFEQGASVALHNALLLEGVELGSVVSLHGFFPVFNDPECGIGTKNGEFVITKPVNTNVAVFLFTDHTGSIQDLSGLSRHTVQIINKMGVKNFKHLYVGDDMEQDYDLAAYILKSVNLEFVSDSSSSDTDSESDASDDFSSSSDTDSDASDDFNLPELSAAGSANEVQPGTQSPPTPPPAHGAPPTPPTPPTPPPAHGGASGRDNESSTDDATTQSFPQEAYDQQGVHVLYRALQEANTSNSFIARSKHSEKVESLVSHFSVNDQCFDENCSLKPDLEPGMLVRVHGLVSNQILNGMVGVVVEKGCGWDPGCGCGCGSRMWIVRLEQDPEVQYPINLYQYKPENLMVNETIFDFARRTIDDSSDSHLSSIIAKAKDFAVSAQHPYDHRGEHALYSAMDRLLQTIQSRRGQGEQMMDGDYEEIKRMVEQDRYKVYERVGKDYAVVQKNGHFGVQNIEKFSVFKYVLDNPHLRADVELMTILIKALSTEDNSHGDHINTAASIGLTDWRTVAHAVCLGLIPLELLPILNTNTHVDWNKLDGNLLAPVHYVVISSNVDILKELLTISPEKLDWNKLDGHNGFTPVRHAVERSLHDASKVDFLKELLKNPPHGLEVDTKDRKGFPPSYYAAKNGQSEILEILFKAGANLAWKNYGFSELPLVALQECRRDVHATKLNKQFEVLKFLVEKISLESNDPSISPSDFFAMDDFDAKEWFSPVSRLIQADEDNRELANEMLEFLLDRGLDANLSSSDGNFYLVDIAQKCRNEAAKQLLVARGGQSWKEHHPNLAWAGAWIGY